jgi:hypothetical protein
LLDVSDLFEIRVVRMLSEPVLEEPFIVLGLNVLTSSLIVELSVIVTQCRHDQGVREVLLEAKGDLALCLLEQIVVAASRWVGRVNWNTVSHKVPRDNDSIKLVSLALHHLKLLKENVQECDGWIAAELAEWSV